MARKTFNVDDFRAKINTKLRSSSPDQVEWRISMYTLLEEVLTETGNYKGFGYLSEMDAVPNGKPGIRYNNPQERWFEDTDHTRRYYY